MAQTRDLTVLVAENPNGSGYEMQKAKESFEKNVDFVQTALGMSDEEISKKRVKELPNLLKKSTEEITVGNMRKFMGKQKGPGVTKTLWGTIWSIIKAL